MADTYTGGLPPRITRLAAARVERGEASDVYELITYTRIEVPRVPDVDRAMRNALAAKRRTETRHLRAELETVPAPRRAGGARWAIAALTRAVAR